MTRPYSKTVKSRGGSGSGDLGASIRQGAELETMRYQNEAALPNDNENNAVFFEDIAKSVSAPGDRPRGIGRNIIAGFSKGLAHGSRSQAIGERKENYDKYEKVMNYFQEANNAAVERNEWFEKREGARKNMMPQVLAYIDNIDKLDPQSQRIMAQDMLSQYGESIGEEFKLSSVDGSNPFLMTIQSDKGQQLFDMRSLFAGNEAMQQAISMKMPEYQMRLQEERQDKLQKFQLEQKKLNIEGQKVQGKYPNLKSSQDAQAEETLTFGDHSYKVGSLESSEKTARAEYQKKVYKDVDSIPKNNQALKAIETMREVFNRNPNIGTSFVNVLDNPDNQDSWRNILGRKLQGQDLTDMEILRKATNDLNLDTILGITGKAATDLLKKAVQAASPSGKLTKGGFDAVAAKWEAKAIEANELAEAKYEAMQQGKSLVPTSYKGKGSNVIQSSNSLAEDDWNSLGIPAQ